jgi:hypothetical protein
MDPRPATAADLPAILLGLYTNEVMTENQAIYTHLAIRTSATARSAGPLKTATAASTWRSS